MSEIIVVGCHGGAGVSTLCSLLGRGAWDMGAGVPTPDPAARPLVLVTSGTAAGAHRALRVLAAAAEREVTPAALAVTGDGPWPQPRAARVRLRMAGPRVGEVIRVPYVTAWRYVDDPLAHPVPRPVARAVTRIRDAVEIAADRRRPRREVGEGAGVAG